MKRLLLILLITVTTILASKRTLAVSGCEPGQCKGSAQFSLRTGCSYLFGRCWDVYDHGLPGLKGDSNTFYCAEINSCNECQNVPQEVTCKNGNGSLPEKGGCPTTLIKPTGCSCCTL